MQLCCSLAEGSAISFCSEWKREAEKDKGNAPAVQGVSGPQGT